MAENPHCVNDVDVDLMTAAHWAACTRNYRIAKLLLSQNSEVVVDLDKPDRWGRSTLDIVYALGTPAFIDLFNRYKFPEYYDPNNPNNDDYTP